MALNIRDKDPNTYVVLGAPHSGTSFLAKALHDQGVDMGTEPSGHYENQDLVGLNSELLEGDWANPPSREEILKKDKTKILEFIQEYRDVMWGFKDPRTSLTAELFLPFLDGDTYIIAIFRKPHKVVRSLARDYDLDDARGLVDHYNENILKTIRNFIGL